MLWTAPELLRVGDRRGTKAGDVYSLSIIASEVVNRDGVWNGLLQREAEDPSATTASTTIDDLFRQLTNRNLVIPTRPNLEQRDDFPPNLVAKIKIKFKKCH
jgi:hypothetical protein